ncbi:MAG TPA: hypothetical protein PLI95_22500 [Polyangiaceae bacterium]|nr:hypothetical protein [Polyangiaceae bacterium]
MSKQMLVLQLCCPHCSAALTQGNRVRLDAYVKDTNQDGEVSLSAVFGEYAVESSFDIPEGAVAEFRCPECDTSVMIQVYCRQCNAPMVSLNQVAGGYVEFCSRRGCKGHAIGGQGDIDDMISMMNKKFNTPYD